MTEESCHASHLVKSCIADKYLIICKSSQTVLENEKVGAGSVISVKKI